MPRFIDRTAQRFGRLTVLRLFDARGSRKDLRWDCACDCGGSARVGGYDLKSGNTQSCGCLQSERAKASRTKHGMCGTSEYQIWQGMLSRCYDKKNRVFSRYGGRGIIVCARWKSSFDCFFQDMGRRPSLAHSLDREDNNGNYDPNNCRWATTLEQANNTRSNKRIFISGECMTVADAARAMNVNAASLYKKLNRRGEAGMCFERAEDFYAFYENRRQNGKEAA